MERAKYIIVVERGHEVPVVFSSLIDHYTMAVGCCVVAAGFCEVMGKSTDNDEDDISVWAGGKSTTLKNGKNNYVVSRGEEDAALIKRLLRFQF